VEDYCVEEVGYATQGEEVCEGQVRENVFVDFGGEDSHCYVPRGPSRFRPGERSEGGFGLLVGEEGTRLLGLDDRSRDKAAFHPSQSLGYAAAS